MVIKLQDVILKLPQDRQDRIHKESDLLFDEFLREQGIYDECRKSAIKGVLDFIGTLSMEERGFICEYEEFLVREINNEQ